MVLHEGKTFFHIRFFFFDIIEKYIFQTSKEEFDRQARMFLKTDQVHLHNEFLLAIVTKCQSLCQPSTYVYHGVKQKPIVVTEVNKIRPIAIPLQKRNSVEIKPITVTRQVQPKNKPLTVNFDVRVFTMDIFIKTLINQILYLSRIDFNQ
jgi:transcriptional adapter 1